MRAVTGGVADARALSRLWRESGHWRPRTIVDFPGMTRGKKILLALVLAVGVSTTSVSCLPVVSIPSCPAGGGPVGC